MRKILTEAVRRMDNLSRWSGNLLAFLVLGMIGIILFEVIMRYFFDRPTIWAMESATMIFGVYMMGGGIYSLLVDGHVRMDILYAKWSPKSRAIADIITFPLFLVFFGILMWKATVYGLDSVAIREHSATAWSPPIYLWKMSVPVIVLLMLLQGLAKFMRDISLVFTGEEL